MRKEILTKRKKIRSFLYIFSLFVIGIILIAFGNVKIISVTLFLFIAVIIFKIRKIERKLLGMGKEVINNLDHPTVAESRIANPSSINPQDHTLLKEEREKFLNIFYGLKEDIEILKRAVLPYSKLAIKKAKRKIEKEILKEKRKIEKTRNKRLR